MRHWNYRTILIVALVVVGFFTASFAVRGFGHARRLRARADEPIQTWMNVPYIAHAYRVHPEVIAQAIGLPPEVRDRRPLQEIAQEQGRSPDVLIAEIMAAIERDRAAPRPPDRPAPPEREPPPSAPSTR